MEYYRDDNPTHVPRNLPPMTGPRQFPGCIISSAHAQRSCSVSRDGGKSPAHDVGLATVESENNARKIGAVKTDVIYVNN